MDGGAAKYTQVGKMGQGTDSEITVFLSHAFVDRHIASRIKENMRRNGIDVFLAHDDIEPGENWSTVLKDELKSRTIFLALITKNYHDADYTDQEFGMALAYGKSILPILINGKPRGFVSESQHIKFTPSKMVTASLSLKVFRRHTKDEAKLLKLMLVGLSESKSTAEADFWIENILPYKDKLSATDKDFIRTILEKNRHVAKSDSANGALKSLLD